MIFMSLAERKRFREGMGSGRISFFRLAECQRCGGEVYKDFQYCSEKCYKQAKELGMEEDKGFVALVARLLGKNISVETRDGVYLTGRLSSIETLIVRVNSVVSTIPVSLRLDDDSEKVIELTRISEVKSID